MAPCCAMIAFGSQARLLYTAAVATDIAEDGVACDDAPPLVLLSADVSIGCGCGGGLL